MRVVLASGCFDVLHPGHVAHLQQARSMGDFLIVALTLDAFVNKGQLLPVYPWEDRALLLRELRCVDHVMPAADGSDCILQARPHIFVKGIDYRDATLPAKITEACALVHAEIRFTDTKKLSASQTAKILRALP